MRNIRSIPWKKIWKMNWALPKIYFRTYIHLRFIFGFVEHIMYWILFLTLHLNIHIKREWICISNLATYNWTCKCITWHLKRKGNRGTNNTISIFSGHNFGLFLSPLREQSRNYNSNICHLNFIKRKERNLQQQQQYMESYFDRLFHITLFLS